MASAQNIVKVGETEYSMLQEAFNAAEEGQTVTLLNDYDASAVESAHGINQFVINKSIIFDGNGHTLTTKDHGIGIGDVNGDLNTNINVTVNDVTIMNTTGTRCIETCGKVGSLALNGVTLVCQGTTTTEFAQPLTIGGIQSDTATVDITSSTIEAYDTGMPYYAITIHNPVKMTITNSTLKGWACINAKGQGTTTGSAGSEINIDGSNLYSRSIDNQVKVLLIGSSHGMNCIAQLPWIAYKSGFTNIVVGNVYKGSLSLQQVADAIRDNTPIGGGFKVFKEGAWTRETTTLFDNVVSYTDWDYIILQRSASEDETWTAGQSSSFDTVIKQIENVATGKPTILFNSGLADPRTATSDQIKDTKKIMTSAKAMRDEYDVDIIPVAEAIQKARLTTLGNIGAFRNHMLCYDGQHLDFGIGCYVASATIFQTIFSRLGFNLEDADGYGTYDEMKTFVGTLVDTGGHSVAYTEPTSETMKIAKDCVISACSDTDAEINTNEEDASEPLTDEPSADENTITSPIIYNGESNVFGIFKIEDNNVAINVKNTNLTIENTGDQYQAIVAQEMDNTLSGCSVALGDDNNIEYIQPKVYTLCNNQGLTDLNITGGTFNVKMENEILPKGYKWIDNGNNTWTATQITYTAKIGDVKYETFDAAIEAVADGDTVILMTDIELKEDLECSLETGVFTLLLGDYNLTSGNHCLAINPGLTIITNKEVSIFSPAVEGYEVVCTQTESGHAYTLVEINDEVVALVHGEPYPYPEGKECTTVTYKRTFADNVVGNYRSWYVPFNYTLTSDDLTKFKFYKIHLIAGAEKVGVVDDPSQVFIYITELSAGTVLSANRPYVIVTKETQTEYIFTAEVDRVYAESNSSRLSLKTTEYGFDIFGTYREFGATGGYEWLALSKKGQISWNLNENAKLQSYVWYIKVTPRTENDDYSNLNLAFVEENETNGISTYAIDADNNIEGIYTTDGIKVETPVKGINIIRYKNGNIKKYVFTQVGH